VYEGITIVVAFGRDKAASLVPLPLFPSRERLALTSPTSVTRLSPSLSVSSDNNSLPSPALPNGVNVAESAPAYVTNTGRSTP
jgi:hypothetical protein